MKREQKLEAAVKAALRLRRAAYHPLIDYGLAPAILFIPAEEIQKFDQTIKELSDDSEQ